MLTFISYVQHACDERQIATRLQVQERIPRSIQNKLIFSHHTYRDDTFTRLEQANNEVWHFKVADLPGRLTLDQSGFAGWSSLAELPIDRIPTVATSAEVDEFFNRSRQEIASSNTSKYQQPARSSTLINPTRPYVFVALQIIDDLVQRHAYVPMLDMLDMVIDRFLGTEYDVVIKRHPRCKSDSVTMALTRVAAKSDRISIVNYSIHDLLPNASAVFTVNSSVGSEAIVYGLPIYCFGKSDYACVAHQIKSREELYRLTSPIRLKCSIENYKRFYYFYRSIYQATIGENLKRRIEEVIDRHELLRRAPLHIHSATDAI